MQIKSVRIKKSLSWEIIESDDVILSFTYIIQCSESKQIKIGTTNHPNRRFKEIQRHCPEKIRTIAIFPCTSNEIEQWLRVRYKTFLTESGWFSPDINMAKDIEWLKNQRGEDAVETQTTDMQDAFEDAFGMFLHITGIDLEKESV